MLILLRPFYFPTTAGGRPPACAALGGAAPTYGWDVDVA